MKTQDNEQKEALRVVRTSSKIHVIEVGSNHKELAEQLGGLLVKVTSSGLSLVDRED